MPRLAKPTKGKEIETLSSFPLYSARGERVITADIWAYLRQVVRSQLKNEEQKRRAFAFLRQAFGFFDAASNPRLGSRALLYYYSFLNLVKTYLLIKHVKLQPAPRHGISDPHENKRARLRLEGQLIRYEKCARNHSQLFPEFLRAIGIGVSRPKSVRVLTLLKQLPGIHRTYCMVTKERPCFIRVKALRVYKNVQNEIFGRIILNKKGDHTNKLVRELRRTKRFKKYFKQVQSEDNREYWFDSKKKTPQGTKQLQTVINDLAAHICNAGLWAVLTRNGTIIYLSTISTNDIVCPLVSIYATMFYLGSITRYKPYDFESIFDGKYSWVINEYLKTQPVQFLYLLAGQFANVEVVYPLVSIE